MTLPPPPALIAGTLLLGWPLIQLASVLWVRDIRDRMRKLAAELREAKAGDAESLAEIDRVVADSHGYPIFVVLPALIPSTIVAASLWELFGRDRPSLHEGADHRSHRKGRRDGSVREALELNDLLNQTGYVLSENLFRSVKPAIVWDKRYPALLDLSFRIGLMRWPVSLGFTILLSAPFLPLYFLAYGLRETVVVIPRLARQFAMTLRIVPQVG